MAVRSNRREVEERLEHGLRAGVTAAAVHYRGAMQKALRGGYTSGAFSQGLKGVAGSVRHTDAQVDADGNVFAAVGTDVKYAKWWELGHENLFIRHWVRAERWRPTLLAEADTMVRRFRGAARLAAGVTVGDAEVGVLTEAE